MSSFSESKETLRKLLEDNLPNKDKFSCPVIVSIRLKIEVSLLIRAESSCNSMWHMHKIIKDIVDKQSAISFDSLYIWFDWCGNICQWNRKEVDKYE